MVSALMPVLGARTTPPHPRVCPPPAPPVAQVMDAVGGGLNLQIARTSSTEKYSRMEQSSLMDPSLSQSLLLDGSVSSPATLTEATATSHLVNVARKAQHLLREQREIERQVSER